MKRASNTSRLLLALAALAGLAGLTGCESGPFAIAAIQPDEAGSPVAVDGKDRSRGMRPKGNITATDPETGEQYRVELKGATFGGEAGDNLNLESAFIFGTGQFVTQEIASVRRNVRTAISVRQTPLGRYLLSTEADDEFIVFGEPDGTNAKLLIPNGDGAVLRFRGRVEGFFEGYAFESEGLAPLEFTLNAGTGLSHTGGAGSVIGPDGDEIVLLAPAPTN